MGLEEEVDSEEPASDFDAAADLVAMELGAEPTPALRSAFRSMVEACKPGDYGSGGEKKEPAKDGGLALVFGGPKKG